MRWIATGILVFATSLASTLTGYCQIITAQPAQSVRPLNAPPAYVPAGPAYSPPTYSPPYSVGYQPNPAVYATPAFGQPAAALGSLATSPEANTIRGWYRDYLGRDVGQDLPSLVNLLRGGMSPTDLQATILGSDEFYSQKGRDPQTFVRQTLQAVNWSEPSYADIQRWTDRLNQLRGDRFALAREILLGSQPATLVGPSQIGDVGTRLASAARLASESIDFELNGTPQGRQANLQAQALVDATNQLQQAAVSRVGDVNLALANADRAYQALQMTLSNPPGTAPSSSAVVRRIGTMISDARVASGGGGYGTGGYGAGGYGAGGYAAGTYGAGGYVPPLGGNQYGTPGNTNLPIGGNAYSYSSTQQQWLDQISAARRAADSLIQTLTSQSYQDYSYNVVLRDLDTLASRLATLDPLVRSGATRDRVALELQSLGDSVERIRSQLNTGRLPYTARLYWQSLDSSLAMLRDSVGVATPLAGSTTLMRPSSLHENLLPLLDQASTQIDVFVAGISPLVYSVPDVASIQADARSLKNRILYMRQQAGSGQPTSVLKQSLAGMIVDYQDAFNRWNQDVATRGVVTPARLSSVGETLNRVEQLINQALVSGDLSPQGPTRVSQDLAQLSGEVNDARRGLAALAGYQQQQSIDLYLQQIASYIQQINTAITQPTTLDARRLAVGMQGVIGRMQTDANSLSQQVTAAYAPSVQQQASDLQLRISRIGRLVDDVESQLY